MIKTNEGQGWESRRGWKEKMDYAKYHAIACRMRPSEALARLSRMGILVMPSCDGGLAAFGPDVVPVEADALLSEHYEELVYLVSMPPASRVLS